MFAAIRLVPVVSALLFAGPAEGEQPAQPSESATSEATENATEPGGAAVTSEPAADPAATEPGVDGPTANSPSLNPSRLADPFAALSLAPASLRVPVEQCDGSRSRENSDPMVLSCERWRVDWEHQGKVWGISVGKSRPEAEQARERVLGFARQYSRYFDEPVDARFGAPTDVICDQCKRATTGGRWGRGQRFSTAGVAEEIEQARAQLDEFERVLWGKHVAYLGDVARLAHDAKTKTAASRYAKDLHAAVRDVPALALELERAEVLQSRQVIEAITSRIDGRGKSLMRSFEGVAVAVAREVSLAHGGRYAQQGSGAEGPQILVSFDGANVKATQSHNGVDSVWFEGTVALDGSLTGRSLVKPRDADLKCQDYTFECGYEYVPSVLRFSHREAEKQSEHLELWFQREAWERAPVFVR